MPVVAALFIALGGKNAYGWRMVLLLAGVAMQPAQHSVSGSCQAGKAQHVLLLPSTWHASTCCRCCSLVLAWQLFRYEPRAVRAASLDGRRWSLCVLGCCCGQQRGISFLKAWCTCSTSSIRISCATLCGSTIRVSWAIGSANGCLF